MRKRRPTNWLLGFAGSAAVHVCALAGLSLFGQAGPGAAAAPAGPIALAPVPPAFTDPDPFANAIAVDVAPPPRAWDAREGDSDSLVPLTTAPSASDGRRRSAPAPDQGDAGGRPPEHAFRRDSSTLRSRLTDGAAEAQPARTRTAGRPASPQAMRREPVVGTGDAVRTVTPRRAPSFASAAQPSGGTSGPGPIGPPADAPAAGEAPPPVPTAELAALALPARTTGPLDAEKGARTFDIERPGKAADDETVRAASSERHPGLTDFTRPAAPAPTVHDEGRGVGAQAGAVARPSSGTAPSELGAPDREATAADVAERARARAYAPYAAQIKNRVQEAVVFPKHLALRLEQGATVVAFVVSADGRVVDGPRVVKSSGFEDFDRAAVQAVRRAAPFPRMPVALPVSANVIFDNPVIR
jgi:protein TonB